MVLQTEPKTNSAGKGEALVGLPGSKSVAREERTVRNLGDPENSRRTNYEGQAGRAAQRQEGQAEGKLGVGSLHSSSGQSLQDGTDVGEGGDSSTRLAEETSTVRMTEQRWPTYLRAIIARVELKSPVREYCTPGSVRGVPGNRCPYLDNGAEMVPTFACAMVRRPAFGMVVGDHEIHEIPGRPNAGVAVPLWWQSPDLGLLTAVRWEFILFTSDYLGLLRIGPIWFGCVLA